MLDQQYNFPLSSSSSRPLLISFCSYWQLFFLVLALKHLNSNVSSAPVVYHIFPLSSCLLFPHGPLLISSDFLLTSPLFNETVFSYAVIPWPQSSQSYLSFMEFEMTFWPSMPDGVLLYTDDAGSGDFLSINLVDRYVEFRFDCGSGGVVIRYWNRSSLISYCAFFFCLYILLPNVRN